MGGREREGSRVLIGVDDKAREGAVLIVVASVCFAAVQFDVDFVSRLQVQDGAVTGVVIVLIRVLRDGACTDLRRAKHQLIGPFRVALCDLSKGVGQTETFTSAGNDIRSPYQKVGLKRANLK